MSDHSRRANARASNGLRRMNEWYRGEIVRLKAELIAVRNENKWFRIDAGDWQTTAQENETETSGKPESAEEVIKRIEAERETLRNVLIWRKELADTGGAALRKSFEAALEQNRELKIENAELKKELRDAGIQLKYWVTNSTVIFDEVQRGLAAINERLLRAEDGGLK